MSSSATVAKVLEKNPLVGPVRRYPTYVAAIGAGALAWIVLRLIKKRRHADHYQQMGMNGMHFRGAADAGSGGSLDRPTTALQVAPFGIFGGLGGDTGSGDQSFDYMGAEGFAGTPGAVAHTASQLRGGSCMPMHPHAKAEAMALRHLGALSTAAPGEAQLHAAAHHPMSHNDAADAMHANAMP